GVNTASNAVAGCSEGATRFAAAAMVTGRTTITLTRRVRLVLHRFMERRARLRVWGIAVGVSAALAFALAPAAGAAQQIISSGGPLTHIYLNDNLGCQADHVGDTSHGFFAGTNPGSCATFISAGGAAYGSRCPQCTP